MTKRLCVLLTCLGLSGMVGARASAEPAAWRDLVPPVADDKWVRPSDESPARPIWGHTGGLRVGLHPMGGPRGLLRVYAPYLDHPEGRAINFIAVEPIPDGQHHRGFSELEYSQLDGMRGKRFWSANDPEDATPKPSDQPARGVVVEEDGVEVLWIFILVERFDNGAHVYLQLSFREDRPYEVGIATLAHDDSVPLAHCIITATMGNYARLRQLHLAEKTILADQLWPEYREDGFAPHARFDLEQLTRTPEGHAVVATTPDEPRPKAAEYAPGTRRHWHYIGKAATQSWRSEAPHPDLQVWVNGRFTYWASQAPIPGGISYENFEMVAPFRQGQTFWFRVEPGRAKLPKSASDHG